MASSSVLLPLGHRHLCMQLNLVLVIVKGHGFVNSPMSSHGVQAPWQFTRVYRYWKPTFEPYRLGLEGRQIHAEGGVTGIAWAPTDLKFASSSEDSSVRVWDMYDCKLHLQLPGHASDCTSVDWHGSLSLLASGSRDTLVRAYWR
jgi:WD40 repeat protein